MKHILNILLSIVIMICTAIACIGSYKSHHHPMTTESHIYYDEEVVLICTPHEWNPPAEIPEIHFSTFETYTPDEIWLLAQLAMEESRGEDAIGQALVIRTVLNRCEKYDRSIEEIIYATGQFSTHGIGTYTPNENCLEAIRMVIYEDWDESNGCLYFSANGYNGKEHLFKHGGHYFSR